MERRLAAILATDVVGYSRLMEATEKATSSHATDGECEGDLAKSEIVIIHWRGK